MSREIGVTGKYGSSLKIRIINTILKEFIVRDGPRAYINPLTLGLLLLSSIMCIFRYFCIFLVADL